MTSEGPPPERFARRLTGPGDGDGASIGPSVVWRYNVGLRRHDDVGLHPTHREPEDYESQLIHGAA